MPESVSNTKIPLMEDFYTLQGEGFHQGSAAYFVRLAGCDVGCVWCDVKDSWDASIHPKISEEEIIQRVKRTTAKIVVITGGEPLMHPLDSLTSKLQQHGLQTHIETSGSHTLTGHWNWICLSPKKFKAPIPSILPLADELKIVVFNKSDFSWAEEFEKQVSQKCRLYLQPEWDKREQVTPLIIDYIKDHPNWQLSLQIHKYINVP